MNIVKFSVKNPVLVNLLMITVLVMGTIALFDLPRQLFPDVDFHWAFVNVTYPGASPEEMEKLVTIPIEDAAQTVDKIKSITSVSYEGVSEISIVFETIPQEEYDKLFIDLKNAVDRIEDLPEDASDPFWVELTSDMFAPMLTVNLTGDLPEKDLLDMARDLQEELLNFKLISKAEISGLRNREIWVEVDPERLYSYNLSMEQVSNAIAVKNLNLPGGTMNVGRSEYLLRTVGEIDEVEQLENVVILKNVSGGQIKIKDVATVIDTLEEATTYNRLNGASSVSITLTKKPEGNIIDLVREVRDFVGQRAANLPEGVELVFTNDMSVPVNDLLSILESNAYIGLIMVLMSLWLFLGWRNAFFAALGIPITFMAGFIFLRYTGESLNGSSLFGLVLVLGIVVDDAIIVVENCFRYIQNGYSKYKAAVIGTTEVLVPILSATATTVAAFLPLMLVPGLLGDFFKVMPITVCLVLAASLIEAFVVLPSHVAEWSPATYRPNKTRFAFFEKLRNGYTTILKRLLRRRHITISAVTALFLVSVAVVIVFLGIDFWAGDDFPQFFVYVELPEGTTLEETDRVIREVEEQARHLPQEDVLAVIATTGLAMYETEWVFKPNYGQLVIELVHPNERQHEVDYYLEMLREKSSGITGVKSIEFAKINTGPPAGPPVEIKARGDNYDILQVIAGEIEADLAVIEGVSDIKNDFNYGKKELSITVDENRAALYNLDIFQIASAVRSAFEGMVASKFRDGDDEVEVIVRYGKDARENLDDFENMKIVTPASQVIPLKDIITYSVEPGYNAINRVDRERAITVTAEIDQMKATTASVNSTIEDENADLSARFPGYSIKFGGEFQEMNETLDSLWKLFLFGLFLMYLILGGQFKSFIQPLMIMYTIPFGFIGAVVGLLLVNSPFTIATMYGVIALAGIVVNDSLVLISFINNARQKGLDRWESIIQAGRVRLRPIILTSITTIFGLLPMALGLGGKSATWGPLAATIVGGLFFSTVFTLFVIPCLLAGVDDIRLFFGAKSLKPTPHLEEIDSIE
ncbi:efflux RND transporter permease subunit [candidate division KSB1 bacterium]